MSDFDPGAGAHDYSEGPPVEPWHGKVGDTRYYGGSPAVQPPHDPDNHLGHSPAAQAQSRICNVVRRLPFAGLVNPKVSPPIDAPQFGLTDFLTMTAEWLEAYSAVIASQADDFTRQARVIAAMKNERASVRAFFGLSMDDYS